MGRYVFRNTADTKDQDRFPAYTINNAPPVFKFNDTEVEKIPVIPEQFDLREKYADFDQLLENNNTLAFIVIRNDSLLYERYFDGADSSSRMTGFSIAKAFVSALTGIAVEEGYIKSVDQPVTDFLTDFKHAGFDKVTIKNLLNMRSGIKFSETYYNPFGHAAKFYYGRDLQKYVYKLKVTIDPGTEYYYNSANTQILAMIIEKTTGMKFSDYFEEKIWSKLGMEYEASWNYDSKKHGMIKAFCCINASAIDFAKFGRLYLNHGNWNGAQVVPEDWVKHSMGSHNDSRDSEDYPFTYFWRVLDNGSVFAKGILGQYIYLDPSRDLIIVRFGKKRGNIHWSALIEEVAGQY
ncbi:MAG: serine hydrolase [Thermodesulfobacteriota bacterium]|nr:serine hydrolase [Thermodesulfobacteriota bacterium]